MSINRPRIVSPLAAEQLGMSSYRPLMSIKAAIVRDSVSSADVPMRIFFRKSRTARHAEVSEAVTSLVLTLFYFIYCRLLAFPPCSPLIVKRTIC